MKFSGLFFISSAYLLTLATFTSCESASDDSEVVGAGTGHLSLEVEHSYDNGRSFVPRGTLNIHSLRSSTASFDSVASVTDTHIKALEQLCTVNSYYLVYKGFGQA